MMMRQIRASNTEQKGLGFDKKTAHHGAEVRAFGYLYMVLGFCNFPFGGVKEWSMLPWGQRGERTTHASGKAGPE